MDPVPPPPPSAAILDQVAAASQAPVPAAQMGADAAGVICAVLQDMVDDPDCAFQPAAALYQDFTVRCRMHKLPRAPLDLPQFQRRLAMAVAGIFDLDDAQWRDVVALADKVPDDMLAPFLMIARAAVAGAPCPSDDAFARAYGTRSPGRVRRLIEHMEKSGLIVVRTDFGGRRSIGVPDLGLTTAVSDA
jgi:hypothetical protein